MNRRHFLYGIAAAPAHFAATEPRAAPDIYYSTEPGSPIFLLEGSTLEDQWDTKRKLNPLVKSAHNPILVKTRDWEGNGPYVYGSVLYDPEDKLLKCWYTVFHDNAYRQHTRGSYMTCYAISEDGYEWHKPELGLVEWNGSRRNNFVQLGHTYNAPLAVVPAPAEAHVGARYVGMYLDKPGVCLALSDDGKTWRDVPGNPIEPHESDTFNCIVYNPLRRKWLAYIRPPVYAGPWKRRVALMESSDLTIWTRPKTVLAPDEADVPEFYGMPVFRRGNLFFGLLEVYDAHRGSIEIELVFSPDGRNWNRVPPREIFLRLGGPSEFDHGIIVTANSPVIMNGEMQFYYGGTKTDHNQITVNDEDVCAIGMGSLPLDRLYGVTSASGQSPGFLVTRPLMLKGSVIELNGLVRGEVRVALLDPDGQEIPGFGLKNCIPIRGDDLRLPVIWAQNKTIKPGFFRLKLQLNDATVYALYVT